MSEKQSFLSVSASLGCHEEHLVLVGENSLIHSDALSPWLQLRLAAKEAGFDLAIASAYRSFERQRLIWNAKLSGEREVLDDNAKPLDLSQLSPIERVEKVMRWSALPGASRHHWGTDIDIYDKSTIRSDFKLQLVLEEYRDDGPFAPMIKWLNSYLPSVAPSFFSPYKQDQGGISPEPWHLSYGPVAIEYSQIWSLGALRDKLLKTDLCEKNTVLDNLDYLFERFILNSINPGNTV